MRRGNSAPADGKPFKHTDIMAEIYQLPEGGSGNSGGGGGIPFSIPIGGGGGGLFGNGGNSLADLFGFAIIAAMFGWNNGGFGGGGANGNAAYLQGQLSNDAGRQMVMQAVTSQGEQSRQAVQTLSTMLGQDFNAVNSAVQTVVQSLNGIAASQGMNVMQVVNAIQSGNASLASQLSQCCCQQQLASANQAAALQGAIGGVQQSIASKSAADQLAMCQQTGALTSSGAANTRAILDKLDQMQTQALQDKLDAARAENTRLSGEISQLSQNSVIAGMIGNAVSPLTAQLAAIRSEVDAVKRAQPATVTVPNNAVTAVPTFWANVLADNVVSRVSAALTAASTTANT